MKRLATVSVTSLLTVGALLVGGLPVASAGDPDFGRLWKRDGVLKTGCHDYRYHYRVKPPTGDWALEVFLRDPSGDSIASDALLAPHDPKRGRSEVRFCRYNTEQGRFKLRGRLTWNDGSTQHVKWVKPGYFRLRLAD